MYELSGVVHSSVFLWLWAHKIILLTSSVGSIGEYIIIRLKHVVRDLVYVYDECNREGVLQVLKPFKSKIVSKIHVLLWKIFAEMVTYVYGFFN